MKDTFLSEQMLAKKSISELIRSIQSDKSDKRLNRLT